MNIKIKYSEIAPTLNDSDSISIYKQIGKITDKKHQFFYNIINDQYLSFNNICKNYISGDDVLISTSLYLMYITIELFIKKELIQEFELTDYNYKNTSVKLYSESGFELDDIQHNLSKFFLKIDEHYKEKEYRRLEHFRILNEKTKYFTNLYSSINVAFPNLRYNCDKKGNYIFIENHADIALIDHIKEVLDYVDNPRRIYESL